MQNEIDELFDELFSPPVFSGSEIDPFGTPDFTLHSDPPPTSSPIISQFKFEIEEKVKNTMGDLIPNKSKKIYQKQYFCFVSFFPETTDISSLISENTLIAYFADLKGRFAPSTLWLHHSILKKEILLRHSIDISTFPKLIQPLKTWEQKHLKKHSKNFSSKQINFFIIFHN